MAKITDLANSSRRNLKAGHWRREVVDSLDGSRRVVGIFHYSTLMLTFVEDSSGSVQLLDADTGHGSVSDQNGMNKLFRALGLPHYYSRRGGALIS